MDKTTRRSFLRTGAAGAAAVGLNFAFPPLGGATAIPASSLAPLLRLQTDPKQPLIRFLSWDTEGGNRVRDNLLRSPGIGLRFFTGTLWLDGTDLPCAVQTQDGRTRYFLDMGRSKLRWDISAARDRLAMTFAAERGWGLPPGRLELCFPFDLRFTPTTVLASLWRQDGRVQAPMILSAPDFGQMLLKIMPEVELTGRVEAAQSPHLINLALTLPPLVEGREYTLSLTPVILDPPARLQDEEMWRLARRGWFNAFQPAAAVGDPSDPTNNYGVPGILTSKDVDPLVSFMLYLPADLMLWTPEVAKGISIAQTMRQSIEFFMEKRTIQSGEVIGYTNRVDFLDSNPAILISAWDYVEATGDLTWLEKIIGQLEWVANFSAMRDVDEDGLVEATQSGNAGTYMPPNRSSNWFDAINYGHKDAYANALIYRAWRCMADMEAQLHRKPQRVLYARLADRLKAAYARQLLNPKTGWLGCWRSLDGVLHDYANPVVNGLAIEYGLVDSAQGRDIVNRLWAKIREVGFTRFDLGIPSGLEPIPRQDYMPGGFGCSKREDGTDTFQQYQNGGVFAGFSSPFLMANYLVGNREQADNVLRAMLGRQQTGGFQNGVHDRYPEGGEWRTWEGAPCGYEGYLADDYYFLRLVLLREPAFRKRFYKPLLTA